MSNRRCPRIRPSRVVREREWLANKVFLYSRHVHIEFVCIYPEIVEQANRMEVPYPLSAKDDCDAHVDG